MKIRSEFNLYVLCGFLSCAVGFVGIFVPLLPTVPFFLLASWCFSKGSPRFHAWILANKYAGKSIKDWEEHRRISPSVKRKAIVTIFISFGISIAVVKPLELRVMLVIIMLLLCLFIATRKSK